MKWFVALLVVCSLAVALVSGEGTGTPSVDDPPATTTTTTPTEDVAAPGDENPMHLNLMWHQHQPFYPKDEDGVYTRPWVRVHATKDYWDMAKMVEDHPGVTATFNLTPVLLLQLEDLANGAKDIYWVKTEIAATDLTTEDRMFIAERFFDVNATIIERFPRFQELADFRTGRSPEELVAAWSDDDFRDLQVLFNLAWTDPGFLAEEPLASLVAKGESFAEEDKAVVLDAHLEIIREVIPLHARLWAEGVIEVTTTPLAHPILPLVGDTNLAVEGDPAAILPNDRFREIADADQQVIRGLDTAERLLGQRPTGMWPGEGSVAQEILNLFSKNDVEWVATGEDVLAMTLGLGSFERDATDTVVESSTLYASYAAEINQREPVAMFFRDNRISDQVGFEYSGLSAQAAVDDFMGRLRAIYDSVDTSSQGGQPPIVSVILDGENAWEHYPNDGIDFLNELYERLAATPWIETTTPSAYLAAHPNPEPISDVFPASWFQPNFATWIGEQEEAMAWDYLYDTRQDLRRAEQSGDYSDDSIASAYEAMLFAEGSDWFWWYGSDQDSGDDGYFDAAFRELLGQVYDALGDERAAFVDVPIIPQTPVVADRSQSELVTIEVDGAAEAAWSSGGAYAGAAMAWAFDKENLYLRHDGDPSSLTEIYLGAPQGRRTSTAIDDAVLGFGATHLIAVRDGQYLLCNPLLDVDPERCIALNAATGDITEIAIPLEELGALAAGDVVLVKAAVDGELVPGDGPLGLQVPDISDVEVFLEFEDPLGDDTGPGTYTYPTDGVFAAGSYDLTAFTVGTEGDDVVFSLDVAAPIGNPWGSPSGLSIQTFDIYIDTDSAVDSGARTLIDGRNASLPDGMGWEYAVTIEGWQPALFIAEPDGSTVETEPSLSVAVFGDQGRIVIRVPRSLLGDGDPTSWTFGAVVLSQEGFPSPGVRRVRDIDAAASQWRGGGAPGDINHTRIFDMVGPPGAEAALSEYTAVTSGTVDDLAPDEFGSIFMMGAQ